jgi:hypothetical protein
MQRLISAMRKTGFSWPTCPEAGTGKPGYEKYDECPAGWSIGYSDYGHGGRREPDLCMQTRNICGNGFSGRHDCQQTVSMPRPLRENPYFFDIERGDGQATRHWFRLRN